MKLLGTASLFHPSAPSTSALVGSAFSVLVLALPGAAGGQGFGEPLDSRPSVRRALDYVVRTEPRTIQEQIDLCEIPAPPFREKERAEEYLRRLEDVGLKNVRMDSEGNVIGERRGESGGVIVLISAHLDTVFPEGTDVTVSRNGTILKGPGISDDCRGLAVVLALARAMQAADVETRGTILFVGTVGEEGPGNLRGVRHLFTQELKEKVDYFISVDGSGLAITKDAVGSNRYRVAYRGPGGHSYGGFGMPNPIHALGRAIAKISELQVPRDPKVTFSVGVIEGGTSVNSIPFEAVMQVDMRSVDPTALTRLDSLFQVAVLDALAEENARWEHQVRLTVEVEGMGIRPGGTQPADAAIVRAGRAAGATLGFHPETRASSTDANVPIQLGIPAVTIGGGGRGQGSHSLSESYDTTDSHLGTQWALLYALTLAGVR